MGRASFLLVATIALAACGPLASESQPVVQTSASTAPGSASTAGPPTSEEGLSVTTYAPPIAVADGAGCSAGLDDPLPAGSWFGYIIDADLDTLTFDVACRFSGTQAALAAAEDGQPEPATAEYIRNESNAVRQFEIVPGIRIDRIGVDGEPVPSGLFFPQWLASGTIIRGQPAFVTLTTEQVKSIVDLLES